jgi:hypothetical protein
MMDLHQLLFGSVNLVHSGGPGAPSVRCLLLALPGAAADFADIISANVLERWGGGCW